MLDELRRRLESEVEKIGITRLASLLGISRGTIYNWIANGNPPLDKFLVLQEHGIDTLYILTGERDTTSVNTGIDWDLLEQVIVGVEVFLTEHKGKLPPDKKAGLIRVLYSKFSTEKNVNKTRFKDFMEAVMATV